LPVTSLKVLLQHRLFQVLLSTHSLMPTAMHCPPLLLEHPRLSLSKPKILKVTIKRPISRKWILWISYPFEFKDLVVVTLNISQPWNTLGKAFSKLPISLLHQALINCSFKWGDVIYIVVVENPKNVHPSLY